MFLNSGRQILKTLYIFAVISSCFLISTPLKATEVGQMIGVYRSGSDGYYLWVDDNWKGITKKWKELGKDGLRLIDIERYVVDGKAKYAGVWRSGEGKYALWRTDSWPKFTKQWRDYSKDGLKLIDIETYVSGGKRQYLGVWRAGNYSTALWSGKGWSAFTKKWKELSKKGQRLIDLEGYVSGGSTHYVGLFKKGSGAYFLWKAASWGDFVKKWKSLSKKKLRLIDIERIVEDNKFKYIGVYRSGDYGYLLYKEKPSKFIDKWEDFSEDDQRLVDLELIISGGKTINKKPVPKPAPKPVVTNECNSIGPYRLTGKTKLEGQLYGVNQSKANLTSDSILDSSATGEGAHLSGSVNSVKLVAGVCVQEGEVEHTLSYRGNVWRLNPLVSRVKAGQCRCYWKTLAWPDRMSFKSTAKVKKANTRYWHRASNCLRPWRKKCQIKTWDGWK